MGHVCVDLSSTSIAVADTGAAAIWPRYLFRPQQLGVSHFMAHPTLLN